MMKKGLNMYSPSHMMLAGFGQNCEGTGAKSMNWTAEPWVGCRRHSLALIPAPSLSEGRRQARSHLEDHITEITFRIESRCPSHMASMSGYLEASQPERLGVGGTQVLSESLGTSGRRDRDKSCAAAGN